MRDSKIFDEAILRFFGPVATTAGLPLSKVKDGVYEITSPDFVMRIRLHTGHQRGLNVILRRASNEAFDEKNPGYGLVHFVKIGGGEWESDETVQTDADFMRKAHQYAQAAERFGIPQLLGKNDHFNDIEQRVAELGVLGR